MLDQLRNFVRRAFTKIILVPCDVDVEAKTAGRIKRRHSKRQVVVTPSERFVWGMVILVIALVGMIVLEAIHTVVTARLSAELLTVISGIVGAFTGLIAGQKM
jgi:hypothetical protein